MSDPFALSTQQIIATGTLTAGISYSLLYLNAVLQWRRFELPKESLPRLTEGMKHFREYLDMASRWKAKQPTYRNDSTWLKQLGFEESASPLKVIGCVEKLLDMSKDAGRHSTMQHAVLEQFLLKATMRMQVKDARNRLLADQAATNKAIADSAGGKTVRPQISAEHPITKALKNAKPVSPGNALPEGRWVDILGLQNIAKRRQLNEDDIRKAYKNRKRSVGKNREARTRLEQAFHQASKALVRV